MFGQQTGDSSDLFAFRVSFGILEKPHLGIEESQTLLGGPCRQSRKPFGERDAGIFGK